MLTAALALLTALQLLLWHRVCRPALVSRVALAQHGPRLPSDPPPPSDPLPPAAPPVSLLVCFRNEATHLEATLRACLAQDYSTFEVLAIDDNSTDASAAIVRYLQRSHPHLRLLQPGPTRPGKKDALTAGIRAARHPLLLLTDADCTPASDQWLRRMTAPLSQGNELVLGCSPYRYAPGPLACWQRFEATCTVLQYQGLARLGLPYMGVGRNLAYHRDFFTRNHGFTGHTDLAGGDDDLLINHAARPTHTARVTDPAAWTYSEPTPTPGAYLRQKWRHQSAGAHYRPLHRWLLAGLALTHGLFYLLGAYLLFVGVWAALCCYFLRAAVVLHVYHQPRTVQYLGGDAGGSRSVRWPAILIADLLLAPYYIFLLAVSVVPRRKW